MGNLYELDYHTHVKTVRQSAVHADNCEFVFENGTAIYQLPSCLNGNMGHPQLGKYQASFPIPNDEEKLKVVLMEEKRSGGKLMEGDINKQQMFFLENCGPNLKMCLSILNPRNLSLTSFSSKRSG